MRSRILAFTLLVASVAHGQVSQRIREYDEKVRAELEALDPRALADWDAASAARDADDPEKAVAAYRRVTEIVPAFTHAHRRLCGSLTRLKKLAEAEAECRKALELAKLPENWATLARTLAESRSRDSELESLLSQGLTADADAVTLVIYAEAAMLSNNLFQAERYSAALLRRDPDGLEANYLAVVMAAGRGDFSKARGHLEKARAAGLPERAYDEFRAKLDEIEPKTGKYLTWAGIAFGGWLGVFGIILLVGYVLSKKVFAIASRAPTNLSENAGAAEHRLRKSYATVLGLSVLFFYLSIPLLLAAVLGLFGGAIYLIFMMGHIPVKLVLLIAVVGFVTVAAVVRSLFVRSRDEDPGTRLALDANPRLREALAEVAAKIGTPPVDSVYMTPGTDFAVTERKKRKERCLILGAGVLDGMGLLEVKSILGHEYGHFRNADTAGGGMALVVRRSLLHMALHMARGGAARWYNPAWWFVRGFWAAFLRISQGATRLQEVLADRWAALAYGSAAFERGLRHVVARSVAFDWHANATVKDALQQPVANFYRHEPAKGDAVQKDLDEKVAKALSREGSEYDSHPPPEKRIAWVRALAVPEPAGETDGQAWDLFADREALERLMTAEIKSNVVKNHNVKFAATAQAE